MTVLRTIALGGGLAFLAACVPSTPAPRPAPPAPPVERPRPEPAPPQPAALEWEDMEPAAGDWRLGAEGRSAAYGPAAAPVFTIQCAGGRVELARSDVASARSLTIRTTFGARALNAAPGRGGLSATLAAADPLLDQMAFSRGRIAVEAAGAPLLVLPTWAELARVVEECRG